MMRHTTFTSVLACALLLSGISATLCHAAEMSEAAGQVAVHGHAPLREPVKRGGRNVPLREALAAIVPHSYSINLPNSSAWADTPVSWRGDRSLADTLKQILAAQPNLFADVDTDLRLVTIEERANRFGSPRRAPILSESSGSRPTSQADAASPGNVQVSDPVRKGPQGAGLASPPADAANRSTGMPAQQAPLLAWPTAAAPAGTLHADVPRSPARTGDVARPAEVQPQVQRQPQAQLQPQAQMQPQPQPLAEASVSAGPADVSAPQSVTVTPASQLPTQDWLIAPSDHTIKNALTRWATEAGWQFVWDVPTDFTVDASATIHGTLPEALDAVVQALKRSQVPIQVILYKGNKVIRVVGEGAA